MAGLVETGAGQETNSQTRHAGKKHGGPVAFVDLRGAFEGELLILLERCFNAGPGTQLYRAHGT